MSHSKLINVVLLFCMLWLAFSGTGAANQAIAQAPASETGPASDDALLVEELPELTPVPASLAPDNLVDSDSWIKPLPHGPQSGIESVVLWDNGPLVTHPGEGYNGHDVSALQSSIGLSTFGFGVSTSTGFRLADDFEVSAANGWQVETISFFSYQSSVHPYPPASTITGLYLQIWDGAPDNPGSSVIFGDLLTNRLISTSWTSIYRAPDTTMLDFQRPVMAAVASVNISLSPGTYWLDWIISGSLASGPWAPPISILGQTTTGNALQYTPTTSTWAPANDLVTGTPQGLPFVVVGSVIEGPPSWKSIASINGVGRSRPAAATVGGKIYIFGGETPGAGRANTVEEYDPRANTWAVKAGLMPVPASNVCAAAIGTDIYIPGGYDASMAYLRTLQVYHTTSDSWSTITTDPLPLALLGSGCAALNGKLYVFGGDSISGYQSGAYVYDPAAAAGSRWSTLASMTYNRAYLGGVAVNGKIYAVGGRNVVTDLSYVEAYNPADNTWHSVTSLSKARGGVGVYAVGSTLYACGGGWSSLYDDCEVYDTTQGYSGAWKSHPALLIEGRRTFAYANIGPVLYAIAGYNGYYLTSAERWSYDVFLPAILKEPFMVLGFDTQFNGNAPGWTAYAGGDWFIGASYLYTSGASPNLWSSAAYMTPFTNLDYQARMMRLGCDTCSNNLIIRGVPIPQSAINAWNNAYMFQYSRTGYFSVFKIVNGVETALQGWTFSPALLTGDTWNTLRVFASGSQLFFYINGTLVWTGSDTSLTTGNVGVSMYVSTVDSSELRMDWATLMTNAGGFIVSDTVNPEQQALNDAANLQIGADFTSNQSP